MARKWVRMSNSGSRMYRAAASVIGILVSGALLLGPRLIAKEASAHPDLAGYWVSSGPGPG